VDKLSQPLRVRRLEYQQDDGDQYGDDGELHDEPERAAHVGGPGAPRVAAAPCCPFWRTVGDRLRAEPVQDAIKGPSRVLGGAVVCRVVQVERAVEGRVVRGGTGVCMPSSRPRLVSDRLTEEQEDAAKPATPLRARRSGSGRSRATMVTVHGASYPRGRCRRAPP
jgi:hypothetical protein